MSHSPWDDRRVEGSGQTPTDQPVEDDLQTGTSIGPPAPAGQLDGLLRLPLGLIILAAERLRADVGAEMRVVGMAGAFLIGLGDAAAAAAGRATRAVARASQGPARAAERLAGGGLRQPPVRLAADPVRRLLAAVAGRTEATVVRGRAIAVAARADAIAVLTAESANAVSWVRQQALPSMIDDLTTDPKIREFAVEQAQGAFADAAREIRRRSADADGWIEARARRLFGRHEPPVTPAGTHTADG